MKRSKIYQTLFAPMVVSIQISNDNNIKIKEIIRLVTEDIRYRQTIYVRETVSLLHSSS